MNLNLQKGMVVAMTTVDAFCRTSWADLHSSCYS